MPKLICPSSDHLLAFLRAYLGDRIISEYQTAGSHYVIKARGCEQDIAVTMGESQIPIGTLKHIFFCARLSVREYMDLANTPKQLKAYMKKRRS